MRYKMDKKQTGDSSEIHQVLLQLVGLRLAHTFRAADMRVFHFGTMRLAPVSDPPSQKHKPRGSVGEFALHIQCPWRIETDAMILTGRSDLYEPVERPEGFSYDQWDYDRDGNLQDQQIELFISSCANLAVEDVIVQSHGLFTLTFHGGYRLVVFPSGSASEDWRLFRPGGIDSHLVVSGGAIERDDE
jgi:hypothetical protein